MEQKPDSSNELLPYHERSFVGAGEYANAIFDKPARELDGYEKEQAYHFARGLFEGGIDGMECEAKKSLDDLDKMLAGAYEQSFYLSYFMSSESEDDRRILEIGEDPSEDEIVSRLYDLEWMLRKDENDSQVLPDKLRKEIAVRSRDYYRSQLAEQLNNPVEYDQGYKPQRILSVNYRPDKLLDKLDAYRQYKQFYREVRLGLKLGAGDGSSDLHDAKILLLNIYSQKINNILASMYGSAIALSKQLDSDPENEESRNLRRRLEESMPVARKAADQDRLKQTQESSEFTERLFGRLDALKQGVSMHESRFTPIDPVVRQVANLLDRSDQMPESSDRTFTPEILSVLSSTSWDASKFKAFFEDVLQAQGLLSADQNDWSEVSERVGRAADGKWQVVISPHRKSLAVSSTKGVAFIPAKFLRTLTQNRKAGVLFVQAHETEHIWQNESDQQLAHKIPLAKLMGRGVSSLREAATIAQETKIYQALGLVRPATAAYVAALDKKLAGGNRLEQARAYFDSSVSGMPQEEIDQRKTELQEIAVDASARISNFSSAPLAYLEQRLLKAELFAAVGEAKAMALMTSRASFSLKDMAGLRQFGLVEPPAPISKWPADYTLEIFKAKYLPALMNGLTE